jgi:LysR family transcriptional regulator, benzoate and cis,cis-muconate-responsive activator of ben and cat genes
MLPQLDVRHLYSVVVLAEELNFTRAAHRLRISQPAFSRQITVLEKQYGFQLVTRDKKRGAQLTEAGRMFVEEARSALLHTERAIHLARAAHNGYQNVLLIGHSTHADHAWISTLLTIRLPLFPKLKVRLTTLFGMELVRSVLANDLHMALVTAPPIDAKLTAVAFAETRISAVFSEAHPAAQKQQVTLQDFANDEWILLPRNVNTVIHDTILETAARTGIPFRQSHGVINAEQVFYLVSQRAGVAILPMSSTVGVPAGGVVMRTLSDPTLSFETFLVMRRDDDSKLVNQYARAFLRKYVRKLGPDRQMELPLSA